MKQVVRITESELQDIITESVKSILKEIGDTNLGQYMLGRTASRAHRVGDKETTRDAKTRAKNAAFDKGVEDQYDLMNAVEQDGDTESAAERIRNHTADYKPSRKPKFDKSKFSMKNF